MIDYDPDTLRCSPLFGRHYSGEPPMTNQQKYTELLAKWTLLGMNIETIAQERKELREEMSAIPFPSTFYFRVGEQVLFRADANHVIQIRTFNQ